MIRRGAQRILAIALGLSVNSANQLLAQDPAAGDASPGVSEEEFLDLIDEEDAATAAAERFSWLRENPIDLNSAQRDELLSIPGMTGEEADAILSTREREGGFASVRDISRVPGGAELLLRIRPYIVAHLPDRAVRSGWTPVLAVSSRLSGLLSRTAAPSAPVTAASRLKSLSRVLFTPFRSIKAGLLFEKDAGEALHDGFVSGYLAYRGSGVLEQAVLGDYSAEVGQGLLLWRGSSMGRNGDLVGGIRNAGGRILPHHVADESHYLRGAAIALKARPWSVPVRCLFFVSRTSLAATVNDEGEVTSFYTAGLYRTATEIEKRNGVHEQLLGVRLECSIRRGTTLGLTYYTSNFDRMVNPATASGFSGRRLEVGGGDFSSTIGTVTLFGEFARTTAGGAAWMAGGAVRADSTMKASIAWRDYSADFHNPHASGFGIQTNTSNERGITLGWSVRLTRGIVLDGYADQCKIPASTYTSLLPRTGSDFLIEMTGLPLTGVRLSLAFRKRRSETMQRWEGTSFGAVSVQGDRDVAGLRFTGRLTLSPHLEAKLRLGRVVSSLAGSRTEAKGSMASQTFCWSVAGIEGECGAVFFESDAYDARLYDFEENLRGFVLSPALYGRGVRWHLVASWNSLPWVRIAAKYALMNVEGSPVARELSVQMELRF
jgi:DNA uptake protein ComE-like DNA-binding protein